MKSMAVFLAGFLALGIASLPAVARETKEAPETGRARMTGNTKNSGGYRPVAFVIHEGGLGNHIREVWLFDAAYDFQDYLAAPFVSNDPTTVLRAIFTDNQVPEHLKIMSDITRGGRRFGVVLDSDLTAPSEKKGTATAPGSPMGAAPLSSSKGVIFQTDQLAALLRRNPILFIHTSLPHDAVAFTKRFLGVFITESKTIGPRSVDVGR